MGLVYILFLKLIFVGVQLLYNTVLAPTVQQSESAGRVHTSLLFWISSHLGQLFSEHGEEFPELDK